MAYDKLLVSGPLARQRLQGAGLPLRQNQIEYVGRPQVEIFLKKAVTTESIKRILYAPTWEGFVHEADYSSVSEFGIALLDKLLQNREFEVVLKPHPFIGLRASKSKSAFKSIQAMTKRYQNLKVLEHESQIYDQMNWCDLMIADIGSVVNDFLATEKPIIVTSVQGLHRDSLLEKFPTTRGAYIIDDPAMIIDVISTIAQNDPMRKTRTEVRKASLGDFSDGSLSQFERVVRNGASLR
jgi:CDP-glycerol glycerophosphotransferase (TagB/SpsB family)